MRRIGLGLVVALLAITACGDSDNEAREEEPSTAYKLASIDGEVPTDNNDPVIAPYQHALDAAVVGCTQEAESVGDEPGVGDLAVGMTERQPEEWTVLVALESIAEVVSASDVPLDCIEISASLLTLTGS